MEAKVKLIDKICKFHPSLGQGKGWSTYTGGMADTGHWFFRKMLDVPIEELQSFLDELIAESKIKPKPMTAEEKRQSENIIDLGGGRWTSELESNETRKLASLIERQLLYGFKITD